MQKHEKSSEITQILTFSLEIYGNAIGFFFKEEKI